MDDGDDYVGGRGVVDIGIQDSGAKGMAGFRPDNSLALYLHLIVSRLLSMERVNGIEPSLRGKTSIVV